MALKQSKLADEVADKAHLSRADAKRALEALEQVVLENVGSAEEVKIGDIVQLDVRIRPAAKARPGGESSTGDEVLIYAKPAPVTVKARPLAKAKASAHPNPKTVRGRREREQVVEDVNLFLELRDRLHSRDLRSLRNALAHNVGDANSATSAEEIHPATGRPVGSGEDHAYFGFLSLLQFFEARRQQLENALTAPQVAKLLNASRQTPLNRIKNNTLLAVLDGGTYRFPSWQFDPEGHDGVVTGLPEVLEALEPQQPFAKVAWLRRPNPTLDDLEPLEVLRRGEVERVVDAAQAAAELP
jgi:excisionase family DNA binding protein